jgi:hypothetical protein
VICARKVNHVMVLTLEPRSQSSSETCWKRLESPSPFCCVQSHDHKDAASAGQRMAAFPPTGRNPAFRFGGVVRSLLDRRHPYLEIPSRSPVTRDTLENANRP